MLVVRTLKYTTAAIDEALTAAVMVLTRGSYIYSAAARPPNATVQIPRKTWNVLSPRFVLDNTQKHQGKTAYIHHCEGRNESQEQVKPQSACYVQAALSAT
jgi:hypothetical protein